MFSDSSSSTPTGKRKGLSSRLNFENVNLENITIRSRRKPVVVSSEKLKSDKNKLSGSDDTFFEGENDSDDFSRLLTDDEDVRAIKNSYSKISGKKNCQRNGLTSGKAEAAKVDNVPTTSGCSNVEAYLASRPQSVPKRMKTTQFDKSPSCQQNYDCCCEGKNKEYSVNPEQITTCRECNKQFRTKIVNASSDEKCRQIRRRSLTDTVKKSRVSNLSDGDYTAVFHPPLSSTKYFTEGNGSFPNTPEVEDRIGISSEKPEVQMSGVKQLKSPTENVRIKKTLYAKPVGPDSSKNKRNDDGPTDDADDDDDDIPCTQPVLSIILRDVVAFIDVRIGNLKISDNLKSELISMGAKVEEKLTKRVTHVIFKDGTLSTYKKAKQWKIPMVSVIWLNDCKTALEFLPTTGYDPPGLEDYEAKINNRRPSKDLFDINRKRPTPGAMLRKFEREIQQKLRSEKKNNKKNEAVNTAPPVPAPRGPVTPPSISFNMFEAFLQNLPPNVQEMLNRDESPSSSEDFHIPIPISIIRKCRSPRKAITDVKDLRKHKPINMESKINERRKNLNLPPDHDVNKENNSEENLSTERRSAPCQLITTHKSERKNKNKKAENIKSSCKTNQKNCDKNLNINSQPLTQSKKRQLLTLDHPTTELSVINDTTNEPSFEQINVKNPYKSPLSKLRKVSDTQNSVGKSTLKRKCQNDYGLQTIKEKNFNDSSQHSNNLTSFSRRSSAAMFLNRKTTVRTRIIPTIVCTGFINKTNLETVYAIVKQLGKFQIEQCVSSRTSHVVVERENFRTVNLLKGIARGCWIVHYEWVLRSLETGKWLAEERFEVVSFSPAVKPNRLDRQAFGPEYIYELFEKYGSIYVDKNCNPPSDDVKELIRLCSGKIVNVTRAAELIIGGKPSLMSKQHRVSEKWVLDCITKNVILPIDDYILHELEFT